MVTILRPRLATSSIILAGVGKWTESHVMYRLPSVCSMSSHSTSYGMSSASKVASTCATSASSR